MFPLFSALKMLHPLAEGVGILAGEAPPEMAADPAEAFSWLVVNLVHGIYPSIRLLQKRRSG
jgi:hypothetical protein